MLYKHVWVLLPGTLLVVIFGCFSHCLSNSFFSLDKLFFSLFPCSACFISLLANTSQKIYLFPFNFYFFLASEFVVGNSQEIDLFGAITLK
jgi:hypothetical protein